MSTWTPAYQPTGSRARLRGRDFPGARCRRRGGAVGRAQRVTAALQVAIAVPLIVLSGISLDRVRSTATADLGFAADQLYAVPLKIDDAKIVKRGLLPVSGLTPFTHSEPSGSMLLIGSFKPYV